MGQQLVPRLAWQVCAKACLNPQDRTALLHAIAEARVWMYTKVGTAWSPVGAHLVAVPLGGIIAPLAYTTLEDNLVLALPPAWL